MCIVITNTSENIHLKTVCYNVPNQSGLCTYHPWIVFILRSDRQRASTDVLREKKQKQRTFKCHSGD